MLKVILMFCLVLAVNTLRIMHDFSQFDYFALLLVFTTILFLGKAVISFSHEFY